MHDGKEVSLGAVATIGTWALVALFLAAMWTALLLGNDPITQGCGFTSGALSAIAAVLHIRRWACRVMELVRRNREFMRGPRTVPDDHPGAMVERLR